MVDFTVTQKGLEEQLLGGVIQKEQKSLEEQLKSVLEEVTRSTRSVGWHPPVVALLADRRAWDTPRPDELALRTPQFELCACLYACGVVR